MEAIGALLGVGFYAHICHPIIIRMPKDIIEGYMRITFFYPSVCLLSVWQSDLKYPTCPVCD